MGIRAAKLFPNIKIMGNIPLKYRFNKRNMGNITKLCKKYPNRVYSPLCATEFGQSLKGDKFFYRNGGDTSNGTDIVIQTDNVLKKPGILLTYIHPPLLFPEKYNGNIINCRLDIRIYGLVKWDGFQIWISENGFIRVGNPMYGEYCWHPKHKNQVILNGDNKSKFYIFKKLDNVCKYNNVDLNKVLKNIDNAVINYFSAYKELFTESEEIINKWYTPFNADIGLDSSGNAYIYECGFGP